MKKIILMLLALFGLMFSTEAKALTANEQIKFEMYYEELERLSPEQRKVLYKAFTAGIEDDLSHTLAAIAWKESVFGEYKTNLYDGSYGSFGVFHTLLDTAISRHNVRNKWNVSRLAEKLMNDFDFSANEAISELKYWKRYWKKSKHNYLYMVASYNAGSASYGSAKGKAYATDIAIRIKVIHAYIKKNDPMKYDKSKYAKLLTKKDTVTDNTDIKMLCLAPVSKTHKIIKTKININNAGLLCMRLKEKTHVKNNYLTVAML